MTLVFPTRSRSIVVRSMARRDLNQLKLLFNVSKVHAMFRFWPRTATALSPLCLSETMCITSWRQRCFVVLVVDYEYALRSM